jgi:hypothetical protein
MNPEAKYHLEQDLKLFNTAYSKAIEQLQDTDAYLVRHAERILKAAKQLEMLSKDLETAKTPDFS